MLFCGNQITGVGVIVVILFTLHQITHIQTSVVETSCKTWPNDNPGHCIRLSNCTDLMKLLTDKTLENIQKLQKNTCGFETNIPLVCCSMNATTLNTKEDLHTMQGNVETPNTISKFEKIQLLPQLEFCGQFFQDRIIPGNQTSIDGFPWSTLIDYKTPIGRGFYCGGVLINQRYVLTAAHCIKGKDLPKNWSLESVRLGEYNTGTEIDCVMLFNDDLVCADPPVDVSVEEKIPHELYDPYDKNHNHDIALLRLTREVSYSDFIKPICLTRNANNYNHIEKYTIVGWGKTKYRSESNIKLRMDFSKMENKKCTELYKSAEVFIHAGQVCAGGEKRKDSCRVDGGGALMTNNPNNWYAEGVFSFGPNPCNREGWPGVYTNVNHYFHWIIENIKP